MRARLLTPIALLAAAGLGACGGAAAAGTSAPPGTSVTRTLKAERTYVYSAATKPVLSATYTASTPTPTATETAPARLLAGRTVGIDPGHNGGNFSDPSYINHPVFNGRESEACDTTGTETDADYSEARFNWNVAGYLAADLRAEGAAVVLTRHSNTGVGPCITKRAALLNHTDVAIDIHADGGPPSGRGFDILTPVADGPNDRVIDSSLRFGEDLRTFFERIEPASDYDGVHGLQPRDDLAGLNLTRVPKVLIETGNMRNAADAAKLTSTSFQRRAAAAMADAIIRFLVR